MSEQPERYIRISERLFELELQNGFFDITVDGVPIWERIRYWTQQKILNKKDILDSGPENSTPVKSPIRRYLNRILEAGRGSIRKNPFLTTGSQIFVWGHQRRKKLDDTWWDIYFDPVYERAPIDYMHVESKYNGGHRTPAKTRNLRYFDMLDFISDLSRKVGVATYELSPVEERELEDVRQAIADEFGVNLDLSSKVEDLMSRRKAKKPLYRRLLCQVDPKIVLLVVSYSRETFVEVCKEEDVPVVEVQHGSPTRYQFGYSYPEPRQKENFPDYLFTFGEYWADTVPFPIDDSRIFPVGYPHLEQKAATINSSKKKKQIVVISQPTIGDEMGELAVELSQSEGVPHKIAYKLHPDETDCWKQRYPKLVESGVRVIGDEDISLYELFSESTGQVGVYSTALYEGLYFGLETFIYEAPGAQQMSDLIEYDYAQSVGTVTELEAKLSHEKPKTTVDTEKIFRSNAVENILRAACKVT